MNKNEWKKWIVFVGRMLLVYSLVFAQGAWAAQDQGTKDKSVSPQKAAVQQKTPAAAPTKASAEAEETVAEEKGRDDAAHQSIKVHGHWTIEVKNPDGALVKHVEFENSLDPGFTTTSPIFSQPVLVPGGAAFLSAVLSGRWNAPSSSLVSDMQIYLVGPAGLSNLGNTTNAPCVNNGSEFPAVCAIGPPSCGSSAGPGFSCNLSVTPLGTSPAFTGVQLTGSVAATQNGQISTVLTLFFNVSCTTAVPNCGPPPASAASFTSSTNFPGAPIAVVAGQTIAVTVNITFS